MEIREKLKEIQYAPWHRLKMNYEQLKKCGIDTGFTSVVTEGKDFHQLTQDICVSFMKFHDQSLTNLLFHNGQPIHLDFDDEIISYYSDYIEIRYIAEGHLEVEIEGETFCFEEGEICLTNSMAFHRESIPNSNCLLLNISIQRKFFTEAFLDNVTLTPLQKFLRKNILKCSDKQHYLRFVPSTEDQRSMIQDYLYDIVTEVIGRKPGYQDISRGFLIRLMDALSTGYHYNFTRQENEQYSLRLFESVSDFIKNNLQTVSMEELTLEFHYQPNYFNNLIKKHMGMTYSDYLIYLRIEKAKQYLEATNITVEEIIWMVGYSNKGFFYRKFRELTGMNPARYRHSR